LHSQRDPLWASEGLGLALKSQSSEPSRLVEINEGQASKFGTVAGVQERWKRMK
jgi:hypothetical protein